MLGNRNSQQEETVFFTRSKPSWWSFEYLGPVLFTILGIIAAWIAAYLMAPFTMILGFWHVYIYIFGFVIMGLSSYLILLRPRIIQYMELSSSFYRVTGQRIEIEALRGIFWRRRINKSIPIADIKEVAVRLDGIPENKKGSITITTINSRSTTIKDILDAEAMGATICQMVRELSQR